MLHQISVPDMHCEKCVERIEKALNETGIKYEINLESKIVTIDGCDHCLKRFMYDRYY